MDNKIDKIDKYEIPFFRESLEWWKGFSTFLVIITGLAAVLLTMGQEWIWVFILLTCCIVFYIFGEYRGPRALVARMIATLVAKLLGRTGKEK